MHVCRMSKYETDKTILISDYSKRVIIILYLQDLILLGK